MIVVKRIHDLGRLCLSGKAPGYTSKDDIVRMGNKVYFIDREGNLIEAKGNRSGKAAKNGFYFNNERQQVLKVKEKGADEWEIPDPAGHNWGIKHKNYKLYACAAYCLS